MAKQLANMSPTQLRQYREYIYRKHVTHFTVFPSHKGRSLSPIAAADRPKALEEFKKRHYLPVATPDDFGGLVNAAGEDVLRGGLHKGSKAYAAMDKFALTDYGSSVIKEILNHPEKFKKFRVVQAFQRPRASGSMDVFRLPSVYPSFGGLYRTSGQKIDPLATIYHEISHTKVFNDVSAGQMEYKILLQDERRAVMKFENPVRMRNHFEPRYAYYRSDLGKTINIITGDTVPGRAVVSKYDPRKLVGVNDPDRLHPEAAPKK